ncbi:MAG: thiolase family protein [Proteobacteria bacterium]|nr:thiolase family protein [Pseudomonadota bacterium]
MKNSNPVFICSPKRTAIGSLQGGLSALAAPEICSQVIKNILLETKLEPEKLDEIILGCVLTAGLGQAPARQAALKAGLKNTIQAMTINKVCSSGLKAVMLAAQSVQLGISEAVIAGGMECMSQAPYLLPNMRTGARLGNVQALDSMIKDGLWDVYNDYHMGNCAELCAKELKISREAQDEFAIASYKKAQAAIAAGIFVDEIATVIVKDGKNESEFKVDEEPAKSKLEKIPSLKPVFIKEGTVTAANASSINDGAAAMIICSEKFYKENNLTPIARIVEQSFHAQAPEWFTTAPVAAVTSLLVKANKKVEDIDLFEINEAFAVVAIACRDQLRVPQEKLNITGGAVALGHPIGASGARILTTLLYSLKRLNKKTGICAICNGGGEATALMVERM